VKLALFSHDVVGRIKDSVSDILKDHRAFLISGFFGGQRNAVLLQRIIKGTSANSFAFALTTVVQIVSVPLLLTKWGVDAYGTWIIIVSITAYLSLCDFGFPYVAGNTIAAAVAEGDTRRALVLFQSVWRLLNYVSFILAAIAGILVGATFAGHGSVHVAAAALFVLQSACSLCTNCFQCGFRATGLYASGVFLQTLLRLACESATLGIAWLGGDMLAAAVGSSIICVLGTLRIARILRKKIVWMELGWSVASWSEIRRLTVASLATMLFPVSFALTLQVIPFLLATLASAQSVAVFATTRTMTRFALQGTAILTHSITPEYASLAAGGRGISWLFRTNIAIVFVIGIISMSVICVYGEYIASIWTAGRISPGRDILVILCITTFIQMLNNVFFSALLGVTMHESASVASFVAALASVGAAAVLIPIAGINGAGFALLGPEFLLLLFMCWRLKNFESPQDRTAARERLGGSTGLKQAKP